jgi:hypothetical protein
MRPGNAQFSVFLLTARRRGSVPSCAKIDRRARKTISPPMRGHLPIVSASSGMLSPFSPDATEWMNLSSAGAFPPRDLIET